MLLLREIYGFILLFYWITCLFNTFPEPPLTFEESPFSTARKFCGVTSCGRAPSQKSFQKSRQIISLNVNSTATHLLLWLPLLYKYLRKATHFSSVVFRNSLIHICAIRPVDHYPWGWVTGNKNIIQICRRKCKRLTIHFGMMTGQRTNDSLIRWRLHSTRGFTLFPLQNHFL